MQDADGYLYVYANYSNGDAHELDASALNVTAVDSATVRYELQGTRKRISLVENAMATSSCGGGELLTVSLSQCAGAVDKVQPPLDVRLPSPVGVGAFTLSATSIAASDSYWLELALESGIKRLVLELVELE